MRASPCGVHGGTDRGSRSVQDIDSKGLSSPPLSFRRVQWPARRQSLPCVEPWGGAQAAKPSWGGPALLAGWGLGGLRWSLPSLVPPPLRRTGWDFWGAVRLDPLWGNQPVTGNHFGQLSPLRLRHADAWDSPQDLSTAGTEPLGVTWPWLMPSLCPTRQRGWDGDLPVTTEGVSIETQQGLIRHK